MWHSGPWDQPAGDAQVRFSSLILNERASFFFSFTGCYHKALCPLRSSHPLLNICLFSLLLLCHVISDIWFFILLNLSSSSFYILCVSTFTTFTCSSSVPPFCKTANSSLLFPPFFSQQLLFFDFSFSVFHEIPLSSTLTTPSLSAAFNSSLLPAHKTTSSSLPPRHPLESFSHSSLPSLSGWTTPWRRSFSSWYPDSEKVSHLSVCLSV